jgi:hypothetical protein
MQRWRFAREQFQHNSTPLPKGAAQGDVFSEKNPLSFAISHIK